MISLETGHKDKGMGDDWKSVDLDGKAPSVTSYSLDKYILQFEKIHFAIWANTFGYLDKYISVIPILALFINVCPDKAAHHLTMPFHLRFYYNLVKYIYN